jgi:hypothetical protein
LARTPDSQKALAVKPSKTHAHVPYSSASHHLLAADANVVIVEGVLPPKQTVLHRGRLQHGLSPPFGGDELQCLLRPGRALPQAHGLESLKVHGGTPDVRGGLSLLRKDALSMNSKLTRLGVSVALSAMTVTGLGSIGLGTTTASASTAKAQPVSRIITAPALSPEARQAIVDQITVLGRQLRPVRATTTERAAVRLAVRDLLKSLKPVRASVADRKAARAEIQVLRAKLKATTSAVERAAIRAQIRATQARVAPVPVTKAVRASVLAQIRVLQLSITPKRLTRAERVVIEQQIRVLRRQLRS